MISISDRLGGLRETAIERPSRRAVLGLVPAAVASLPLGEVIPKAGGLTPLQSVAASGVALSGAYPGHLQGVCTNGRDAIYWSMTTNIVKTDVSGKHHRANHGRQSPWRSLLRR